jgi:hypothetical protein
LEYLSFALANSAKTFLKINTSVRVISTYENASYEFGVSLTLALSPWGRG